MSEDAGAMTGVWNPQWGRHVPVESRLIALMAGHNYEPWHSGGGCMGWYRGDDREYWLITNEALDLEDGDDWVVGRYVKDAWVVCDEPSSMEEALRLADLLPLPSPDDPERSVTREELTA